MCVCVGGGWGLGGMELRVGSNIMISFPLYSILPLLIRHRYFFFLCVCVYICIFSCYICITFMNIITFEYFVFT